MKDWTSLLIQKKRDCSERPTDASTVLTSFLSFLKAAAGSSSTDTTAASVLASLLFGGLVKMTATITDFELKKLNDSDAETTTKSGKLDALSDYCLGVVMSFVSAKDRCKAVEGTCHRLFHASRRTPVFMQRMNETMRMNLMFDNIMTSESIKQLMKRVRVQHLDLEQKHCGRYLCDTMRTDGILGLMLSGFGTLTQMTLRSADFVKRVTMDSVFAKHFTMRFPQLCEARLTQMSAEEAVAFLSLNGSIQTLSLANITPTVDTKSDLMVAVSNLKNLRSLKLELHFLDFPISAECDFTHISDLALFGEVPDDYYSKLFLANLECLELQKWDAIGEAMTRRMEQSLCGLKQLKVFNCSAEFSKSTQTLACALPRVTAFAHDCDLRGFPTLLSDSSAPHITALIALSEYRDDAIDELNEKWMTAFQRVMEACTLQSLTVVIKDSDYYPMNRTLERFLVWLSQLHMYKPCFAVRIGTSSIFWDAAGGRLSAFVFRRLSDMRYRIDAETNPEAVDSR